MRRVGLADATALGALLKAYFRSIEHEVGAQDESAAADFYVRTPARAWIAFVGADRAGCVALRPLTPTRCELKHLFVAPAYRGLHVAQRLVRAVHRYARTNGFDEIFLDTLGSMRAAQALYAREGYAVCAPYHDDRVPKIFMKRRV